MVQINFAQKSVTVKIVFYGPGMSGKTTNLEIVHQRAPESNKGDLTSISTDGDRTLFFDFMPLDLGTVAGMRTQFQIYTVPGQVYYNSTRKLVLQGVDGVIFVADSSASMVEENLESLRNLEENLAEYGKNIDEMPMVIQYNKRDLPDALPVEELQRHLNRWNAPNFEAVANTGQGVFPTLKALAARVLDTIHEQTGSNRQKQAATGTAGMPAPQAPAGPSLGAPVAGTPAAAPAPAAATPPPMPAPAPPPAPAPAAATPPPFEPAAPTQPVFSEPAPMPAPMHEAPAPPPAPESPAVAPLRMADGAAPAPAMPTPASQPAPQPMQMAPAPAPAPAPSPAPAPAPPSAAAPAVPPMPAPPAPAPSPMAHAPAPAPAGRQPVPGPGATRLRPRAAAAPPAPSKSKSTLVTVVIVAVALAAGIGIGGAVFKLL